MVVPNSCKELIDRERISECCAPHLEGIPLKQQVHYLNGCCSYLANVIITLLQVVNQLERRNEQIPP